VGRMTKAQREDKAQQAVELSARGMSYSSIARQLRINWKTARKLVDDELAKRAEHRGQDTERHLAVYDAIQQAAWERFQQTDNRSLNASGYLNTIKAAEDSKAKITGAEAPIKIQDVDEDYEVVWDDAGDSLTAESFKD
jgi:orotate phosphoribosyltransferase-like protein